MIKISDFIDDFFPIPPANSDWIKDIKLSVEEICTNVIKHGYRGYPGIIQLEFHLNPQYLQIIIQDNGPEFDPTTNPLPQFSDKLIERKTGGLGIFLVKNLMTSMEYKRIDNINRLILKKATDGEIDEIQ